MSPRRRGRTLQQLQPRLEKHEQAAGVELVERVLKGKAFVSGTRRPKGDYQGTRQTPGIPDVEFYLPPIGGSTAWVQLKWEAKRPDGGSLSAVQREYRDYCGRAGVAYVSGNYNELVAWLVGHRYLSEKNIPHYRVPAAPAGDAR